MPLFLLRRTLSHFLSSEVHIYNACAFIQLWYPLRVSINSCCWFGCWMLDGCLFHSVFLSHWVLCNGGSVPAFVDHMELVTLTKRTGFLELIPTCKSHESFLSSSNFEYPSAKFAPTGCRSYPSHILRNYAHTKIAITDKFTQSSFGKPVHHHVLRLRTRLRRIRDCLPTPVCKSVHHSHYTYRKNR